jgi:hypothetical protein
MELSIVLVSQQSGFEEEKKTLLSILSLQQEDLTGSLCITHSSASVVSIILQRWMVRGSPVVDAKNNRLNVNMDIFFFITQR